ncbi:MAG: tRNA lysidine(34) synthetase TilS [Rubrimonas sp.]|uniref:tRNA lysidine(34) synthetase TilS n=1 Tax=Rubrimonas sp. TaxID=2036015 RepID=UPI002FDE9F3C
MSLEARVGAALDRLHPGGALGLAVSGGGDSTALAALAADWAAARGVRLAALCVDHGLRPESAAEAETARRALERLGAPAQVARWEGWDGRGNLQAEARAARSRLIADWARAEGLAAVATGHTRDDQAETLLLRLARGSGVDGLAAMAERSERAGVLWLRPLLETSRAELRDWLRARGLSWVEDPSNDDPRFDRVRARRALAALAPLGLTAEGLAATAARMRRARAALDVQTAALASRAALVGLLGEVALDRPALLSTPEEIALRLLAGAARAASGAEHPPRLSGLTGLLEAVTARESGGRALHGCVVRWTRARLLVAREPAAAARAAAPVGGLWDGRFAVDPDGEGAVAALGASGEAALAAARACGDWSPPAHWRAAPRAARLSAPALWRGATLAAAPLACYGSGLVARRAARVELPGAALMCL